MVNLMASYMDLVQGEIKELTSGVGGHGVTDPQMGGDQATLGGSTFFGHCNARIFTEDLTHH